MTRGDTGGRPVLAILGGLVALGLWQAASNDARGVDPEAFRADWAAIDGWAATLPEGAAAAEPDPGRLTTVIVLDDSGSMGADIEGAKTALLSAVRQMPPGARVAVLGLNGGLILPMAPVARAIPDLPGALGPVRANGDTPLGATMREALRLIEAEAAAQRGFGTYRIVVTTDGDASDAGLLEETAGEILRATPVEVATIGVGIGRGHPLNLPGLTTYAAVDDVADLEAALAAVSAEQRAFDPVTAFEED